MISGFENYVYLTNNFASSEDFIRAKLRVVAHASKHHRTVSQLRLTWTNRFRMAVEEYKRDLNDVAKQLKSDNEVGPNYSK